MAVLGGQRECAMPIVTAGHREQLSRIRESPQSGGCGGGVHSSAAPDERFGGAPVPESQSGHERRRPLAGTAPVNRCAKIQERLDQRNLHSGLRRVTTRHQHAHRRVLSAVHPRQCVNFGAGFEQDRRDFNGVIGCSLAVTFDAVGGDVMKKRGPMRRRGKMRDTRRPRSN